MYVIYSSYTSKNIHTYIYYTMEWTCVDDGNNVQN